MSALTSPTSSPLPSLPSRASSPDPTEAPTPRRRTGRQKLLEARARVQNSSYSLDQDNIHGYFGGRIYDSRNFLNGLARLSIREPDFHTVWPLLRSARSNRQNRDTSRPGISRTHDWLMTDIADTIALMGDQGEQIKTRKRKGQLHVFRDGVESTDQSQPNPSKKPRTRQALKQNKDAGNLQLPQTLNGRKKAQQPTVLVQKSFKESRLEAVKETFEDDVEEDTSEASENEENSEAEDEPQHENRDEDANSNTEMLDTNSNTEMLLDDEHTFFSHEQDLHQVRPQTNAEPGNRTDPPQSPKAIRSPSNPSASPDPGFTESSTSSAPTSSSTNLDASPTEWLALQSKDLTTRLDRIRSQLEVAATHLTSLTAAKATKEHEHSSWKRVVEVAERKAFIAHQNVLRAQCMVSADGGEGQENCREENIFREGNETPVPGAQNLVDRIIHRDNKYRDFLQTYHDFNVKYLAEAEQEATCLEKEVGELDIRVKDAEGRVEEARGALASWETVYEGLKRIGESQGVGH